MMLHSHCHLNFNNWFRTWTYKFSKTEPWTGPKVWFGQFSELEPEPTVWFIRFSSKLGSKPNHSITTTIDQCPRMGNAGQPNKTIKLCRSPSDLLAQPPSTQAPQDGMIGIRTPPIASTWEGGTPLTILRNGGIRISMTCVMSVMLHMIRYKYKEPCTVVW